MWKDKNKLKIKVVSHKRTVSSQKKNDIQTIYQIVYFAERTRAQKIWFVLNKNTNHSNYVQASVSIKTLQKA